MRRATAVTALLVGCGDPSPAPLDPTPLGADASTIKPNGVRVERVAPPPGDAPRWLRCEERDGRCDLPTGIYVPVAQGLATRVWAPEDGRYLNEPALIRDREGTWHVISNGAQGDGDPWRERSLLHGTAPSLLGPWRGRRDALDGAGLRAVWGAHLTAGAAGYSMVFYAQLGSEDRGENRLARSMDLDVWEVDPTPLPGGRDAMALRLRDGRELLYSTAVVRRDGALFDAVTAQVREGGGWVERVVMEQEFPCRAACWGFYESPYVIALGGMYYLFTTYTDSGYATYEQTTVHRSSDPLRFAPTPVAVLEGHGGEVHVEDGRFYFTRGGWPSRIGEAARGLSVQPIAWVRAE